jgi:small subunit ribosomal protein S9
MMADEPKPEAAEQLDSEQPAAEPEPSASDAQGRAADASHAEKEREEGAPATDAALPPDKDKPTKAKPRKRSERRTASKPKKSGVVAGADAASRAGGATPQAPAATSPPEDGAEAPTETAAATPAPAAEEAQEARAGPDQESPQEEGARAARPKSEVPGAHLEVDIVPEGVDPLGRARSEDPYAIEFEEEQPEAPGEEEQTPPPGEAEQELVQPIVSAAIDLAADARYRATGKRKTAVARVILRPGAGAYSINGRPLQEYFPRSTLQRNISQPLEAVGYQDRMDVVARLHGGGVSSQAGALRHGISRALLEADPSLRGELKRRGFLTRDSRVKERKKAGLKKARKRPQFSKR